MSLKLPITHRGEITCTSCGSTSGHAFTISRMEFESSDDRGMGEEVQYSFAEEVTCHDCNRVNEVCGTVWEYPIGAVNLIELD